MPKANNEIISSVLDAARFIQQLSTGDLAELRRLGRGRGAPAFWRLAARCPSTIGHPDKEEPWKCIVQVLAILTAKGEPESRPALHAESRRLGTVLCDGGDPAWPGQQPSSEPKPVFSETRLMKLIAARGTQRLVMLTRAARTLATKMTPGSGINVKDVAWTVLNPNNERQMAQHYYSRLDAAAYSQSTQGEETDG